MRDGNVHFEWTRGTQTSSSTARLKVCVIKFDFKTAQEATSVSCISTWLPESNAKFGIITLFFVCLNLFLLANKNILLLLLLQKSQLNMYMYTITSVF